MGQLGERGDGVGSYQCIKNIANYTPHIEIDKYTTSFVTLFAKNRVVMFLLVVKLAATRSKKPRYINLSNKEEQLRSLQGLLSLCYFTLNYSCFIIAIWKIRSLFSFLVRDRSPLHKSTVIKSIFYYEYSK